jgi:hypothetical protein
MALVSTYSLLFTLYSLLFTLYSLLVHAVHTTLMVVAGCYLLLLWRYWIVIFLVNVWVYEIY